MYFISDHPLFCAYTLWTQVAGKYAQSPTPSVSFSWPDIVASLRIQEIFQFTRRPYLTLDIALHNDMRWRQAGIGTKKSTVRCELFTYCYTFSSHVKLLPTARPATTFTETPIQIRQIHPSIHSGLDGGQEYVYIFIVLEGFSCKVSTARSTVLLHVAWSLIPSISSFRRRKTTAVAALL